MKCLRNVFVDGLLRDSVGRWSVYILYTYFVVVMEGSYDIRVVAKFRKVRGILFVYVEESSTSFIFL